MTNLHPPKNYREECWTKEEFILIVNPCGYRFAIWLLFLRRDTVTLLNVLNAWYAYWLGREFAVWQLDKKMWQKGARSLKRAPTSWLQFRKFATKIRTELMGIDYAKQEEVNDE